MSNLFMILFPSLHAKPSQKVDFRLIRSLFASCYAYHHTN
jgi:hypothetical protein